MISWNTWSLWMFNVVFWPPRHLNWSSVIWHSDDQFFCLEKSVSWAFFIPFANVPISQYVKIHNLSSSIYCTPAGMFFCNMSLFDLLSFCFSEFCSLSRNACAKALTCRIHLGRFCKSLNGKALTCGVYLGRLWKSVEFSEIWFFFWGFLQFNTAWPEKAFTNTKGKSSSNMKDTNGISSIPHLLVQEDLRSP